MMGSVYLKSTAIRWRKLLNVKGKQQKIYLIIKWETCIRTSHSFYYILFDYANIKLQPHDYFCLAIVLISFI